MKSKILFILFLMLSKSNCFGDEIYHYTAYRCFTDVGLFEMNELVIYNHDDMATKDGYFKKDHEQIICNLEGGVGISLVNGQFKILKNDKVIFSGKHNFSRVRIFAEKLSVDEAEFCWIPSDLAYDYFKNNGGCIARGFPFLAEFKSLNSYDLYKLMLETGKN